MRLTLRTLLCWLDDTLPAAEVRAIGQQVHESAYARELVERIRKVTRQRRLSVPPSSGPEATDPNLVADYLDNTLPADKVAEYERLCLKSDVHLAEVASAHQILSLLGQKAKVPPDARYRMYHLVKGREALGERARRSAAPVKPDPVAAEVPTWRPEPTTQPSANARRTAVAITLAALLLGWSTWDNLRPRPRPADSTPIASAPPPAPAGQPAAVAQNVPAQPKEPAIAQPNLGVVPPVAERPMPPPALANVERADPLRPADAPGEEAAPPEAMPQPEPAPPAAKPIATLESESGVLLTRAEAGGAWRRLSAGAALNPGEPLLNLDPFRSTLRIDSLSIQLIDATQIRLLEPTAENSPSIALDEGRLIARADAAAARLNIALPEATLALTLPTDVPVGLERTRQWQPGQSRTPEPGLVIYLPEAELSFRHAGQDQTVRGPVRLAFSPTGELREQIVEPSPAWVLEPTPPVDRDEAGRQLLSFFKPEKPPITSLVEAINAESPSIRRLAFQALSLLNQFPLLIDALQTPRQPETRRAAIDALRQALTRGESASNRLLQDLQRAQRDPSWGSLAAALLRGYSPEDLADETIRSQLLAALEHPDLAIRELALDNLIRITRRGDSMGYDPEEPTPRGLKAWRDLLPPRSRNR
ncbi:MAG: hypothetical protein KatS3mg108_3127 [Isosphaeraceae bacterium]|jgi:hypothetical protein|nr:MAG: hypothetical protein KatS3mg108_3127 [Isosphaeraceae bacterium]